MLLCTEELPSPWAWDWVQSQLPQLLRLTPSLPFPLTPPLPSALIQDYAARDGPRHGIL